MARPREFDDDAVMSKVADLFTEHGYNGTSISMLTEATGMGKQSLYNAFGDKEALYLKAVDCSVSRHAQHLTGMDAAATGRLAVEAFFNVLVGACAHPDPAQNNCIVSSGLLEGIDSPLIPAKLEEIWAANHRFLSAAVERGQADGSIRRDLSAPDMADILLTLTSGLRVSARAIKQKTQLQNIVRHCLEILNPPPDAA
jgi:TetR/AcrR family transcriptional regulator, transcriptional repressor for nem operon